MTAADDLRALSAAATPGPWEDNDGQLQTSKYDIGVVWSFEGQRSQNAELVVWLRNHADALADLIDAAHNMDPLAMLDAVAALEADRG